MHVTMMHRAAILFLASTCLTSIALAEGLRPDSITLSSSGLAEITASGPVDGATVITFDAPLAQVDDVLKSLVVSGEGISVRSVDLAGREPLSDTFAALPFKPGDLENSVTLLAALKGVEVEVTRAGITVRGVVLGVENTSVAGDNGAVASEARLSVATDAGRIEHVLIDPASQVTILDETVRAALLQGLGALAADRSTDRRTIEVRLEGPASGRATLTYVIAAPVWKPTWRVVLPADGQAARFQGWAVLENRTGIDWADVNLTLSSGTPVTLHQSLYESVMVPRPEAPLRVGQRLRPEMDEGVMREQESMAMPAPAMAPPPGANFRQRAASLGAAADSSFDGRIAQGATVDASESLAAASFRLDGAVSLAVGRSLTLPFFDGEAKAARVSVFQPGTSDRHPIAAVRVTNGSDVTLPGGIVTVYEAGVGFVGDAEFAGATPGEERILPYALDTKVRIARDVTSNSAIRTARVVDGLLRVEYGREQTTAYRVEGDPAAPRDVIIEHQANSGWDVESDGVIEGRDGDKVRIARTIAAGEARTINVTETVTDAQRWALVDAPDQVLLDVVAAGDRIDARLRDPLNRIVAIRQESAAQQRAIQRADEAIGRIREDQERVRENLSAVDRNGDLARTYQQRLQTQEQEMARLEAERQAASDAYDKAQAELAEIVRTL
jgi:hypothetical protein